MVKNILFIVLAFPSFNLIMAQTEVNANEIIERIKSNVTCEWQQETVDTYKGGTPGMEVTGIATTFLATMDVLIAAKERGLNLIITHEPTFYNHMDNTEHLKEDAVYKAKENYIKENNLIVFRFHDHIHDTYPDGIYKGVVDKLNWKQFELSQDPFIYKLPEISLNELGDQLKELFENPAIRIVGSKDMILTNVSLVLGAAGAESQMSDLRRDDVDAIIIGETNEWETVEYVRDAVSQGKKKALIIIGHVNSEEAGMEYCAEWLKTFVKEVPIEFIPAGNPFWTP